ncbi:MAG: Mrp/NBP35 family ATP-binding protein [Chloroflexi bacterium]|nr:Mrp/NBP35 family ATP-binding protein [Chloroflexota bacterium]
MASIEERVMGALRTVIEPELNQDIVTLDMVRDLSVKNGAAEFTIVLTTPACPLKDVFVERCNAALIGIVEGISEVRIKWDAQVPTDRRIHGLLDVPMNSIVAIASGKGGVGKSTVATNLAVSLADAGASVGLIDADILNPNIPQMFGLGSGRPKVSNNKMQPLEVYGVKLISTGFLTTPDKPMIMRGPMLHSAIRQFFTDVDWGRIDYMIVDLPPGTGDAPLSLAQSFPLTGSIIVTQPQAVAVADALRAAAMFDQLKVPVLGVVENMSGEFFGSGGGEAFANQREIPFLGRIPLASEVRESGDLGRPVAIHELDSESGSALRQLSERVAARISLAMLQGADVVPINIID